MKKFLFKAALTTCVGLLLPIGGFQASALTLEYWSTYNETEKQSTVLRDAATEFMKEHPDVKINFTFNGRDNYKLLPTAVEGGQTVNLYDGNSHHMVSTFSSFTADIDNYLDRVYPTTEGKKYIDYTSPSLVQMAKQTSEDGKIYFVPMNPQAFTIFYNKAIFEEVGITELPKTWDELLATMQKIKDAGYTPLTSDPNYVTSWFGYYLSRLKGQDFVRDLVKGKNNASWDDPAVLESLKALQELATRGFVADNISTNTFPQAQQEMVVGGQIAMYINGSWFPNEVSESAPADFKWGVMPFPTVMGGVDDTTALASGSYGIGFNKKNSEEEMKTAVEFATYINTKFDKKMVEVAKAIPVTPGNKWPAELKELEPILTNMKVKYDPQTAITTNKDMTPILQDLVLRLLAGEITPEDFVQKVK